MYRNDQQLSHYKWKEVILLIENRVYGDANNFFGILFYILYCNLSFSIIKEGVVFYMTW